MGPCLASLDARSACQSVFAALVAIFVILSHYYTPVETARSGAEAPMLRLNRASRYLGGRGWVGERAEVLGALEH